MANEEKTEDPTSRRLEKAKEKGDVARSRELPAALGLFCTVLMFAIFIPSFARTVMTFQTKYFNIVGEFTISSVSAQTVAQDFFATAMKLLMPIFVLLVVVVMVMEWFFQGGITFQPSRIEVKWEKVFFWSNIPKELKKILVSANALFELVKTIIKVIIIFAIAYFTILSDIPEIIVLPSASLSYILKIMGKIFLKLSMYILLFLLALSIMDFMWQKYTYIKRMKMSKQDIKDEHKQMEGDPQVKGKQKRIQYQWAMQRMMAKVPEADVVITNPTHFAVALKYEFKKMQSPQLLAKGQDLIAKRLIQIAKENNVPVVENPPVARAVFASVEVEEFIPAHLFKPIAEILAYIYKLKGKRFA